MTAVAQRFDKAAPHYDKAASVQARVAERLVAWAQPQLPPQEALDIGAGTGFVAQAVMRRWPAASATALDGSMSMLQEAQQKLPALKIISGDALQIVPQKRFDAAFSSMALHWLPQPRNTLQHWQGWLKPGGRLYVALLTADSFKEWRDLCYLAGLMDGLWPMPRADFADGLAISTRRETMSIFYPSAEAFLRHLKLTGAATPRHGHVPLAIPVLRRLLAVAPRPFRIGYDVQYLECAAPPVL